MPIVQVREKSTDIVFLLEDGTLLHIEFQSTYSKNDIIRFAIYDILLYERHGRLIKTVIIYSSDVMGVSADLDTGSLIFNPQVVLFADYDGNVICKELETKLSAGDEVLKKLLEVINMGDLWTMLYERAIKENKIEIAKKALKEGSTVEFVSKITDLDVDTIMRLKDELASESISG